MSQLIAKHHTPSRLLVLQLLAFSLLSPALCRGQQPEATSPASLEPVLKTRTQAASPEYQLGGGDEVSVQVANRPEVSGTFVLSPEGDIHIPFAGSVRIADMSTDQAAKAIEGALLKLYASAVVDVQISKYGSNRILLLGDIEHPGTIYFNEPLSLLDVITRGGSLVGSDKTAKGMPWTCTIYHKENSMETVDMRNVSSARSVMLRRDDIVYIPGDDTRLVSVIGEVKNPGPVTLRPGQPNLLALLADAGGITAEAGSPTIQIINPTTHRTQKISYKDLTGPRGTDVSLEVGDVVFVPRSGLAKLGFVLQQIAPGIQAGTIAAMITH
jgi:polysaccharide export outer membrane protein